MQLSHESEATWLRILIQLAMLQNDLRNTPMAVSVRRWSK